MKYKISALILAVLTLGPLGAQDSAEQPDPVDLLIRQRTRTGDSGEKNRLAAEIEKIDQVLRGSLVEVIPGTFHPEDNSWIFTVLSRAPELPWETTRMVDGRSYADPLGAMAALKAAMESGTLEGVITYRITARPDGTYACVVKTVHLEDRRSSLVLATTSPNETVAVFGPDSRWKPVTTASLEVLSTPPGAQVRLDGVFKGVTPLALQDILPYRTEVELSWELGGQQPWKTYLDPEVGKSYRIDYRSTSLEMAAIPGGSFPMGNPQGYEDEKPLVNRTVSSFLLSKTEVTQALWKEVMGSNPSFSAGENLPVDSVTWLQTLEFCNRLSLREGFVPAYVFLETGPALREDADGYRLPTEAEWEYAARGGGVLPGDRQEGWHGGNSGGQSHPARSWKPNAFGLYDMAGNLWEWIWDDYAPYGKTSEPNFPGPGKVIRGGSWLSDPGVLRTTHRDHFPAASHRMTLGFRVARSGSLTSAEGVQP